MATKKATVTEEVKEEILAEEEAKQAEEPRTAWDEKVTMVVPRKPKGEDQQFYVCVNDRRFIVPANGQLQELPKPVADILQDAIAAEYAADEFADSIPNSDPVQNMQQQLEKMQQMMNELQQMQGL